MTTPEPEVVTPTTPISGLPSSPELKARIVDFMERADELLAHELAHYQAPFTLNVTMCESTGGVLGVELDHRLLDKGKLVYFATIQRPILWTESEPIYITELISALGKEHPNLRPHCGKIADVFKDWKNRLFIGTKSGVSDPENHQLPPSEDRSWKITNVHMSPVGTPFPEDQFVEAPMVDDMYYAKVYLNGFVWHNDAPKTAEYRAATELEQLHYRKCAEIRVFSGLQMVIKPVHQFFLDARTVGEDL